MCLPYKKKQMSGPASGRYQDAHFNLVEETNVEPLAYLSLVSQATNPAPSNANTLWLDSNHHLTVGTALESNVVTDQVIRTESLSNGVAKDLITPTVPVDRGFGGVVYFAVEVRDGTDIQVRSGRSRHAMVNKAGTFTTATGSLDSVLASSSGTLAVVFGVTAAGVIQVTATSSLTPTSIFISYRFEAFHNSEIALVYA